MSGGMTAFARMGEVWERTCFPQVLLTAIEPVENRYVAKCTQVRPQISVARDLDHHPCLPEHDFIARLQSQAARAFRNRHAAAVADDARALRAVVVDYARSLGVRIEFNPCVAARHALVDLI